MVYIRYERFCDATLREQANNMNPNIEKKIAQIRTRGFNDEDIESYILESLDALYTLLTKSTK